MLNRSNWIGVAALLAGMVIQAPGGFPVPPELEHASETQKRQYLQKLQIQSELALHDKIRVGEQRYQQRQAFRQALVEGMRAKAVERRQAIYTPPAAAPVARSGKPRSPMLILLAAALLVAVFLVWRHLRSGGSNETTALTAGVLAIRKFSLEIASFLNPHFNPSKLSPSTAANFSEKIRAEDEAFSEFLTAFRTGPSATPGASPLGAASVTERGPLQEFFAQAPELLGKFRKLLQEIDRAPNQAAQQRMLADLQRELCALKGEAGLLELLPVWQMAAALEGLVKQLADNVGNVTPSTLRSVAGGVDLLKDLCIPGVQADLLINPPLRILAVDDDLISRRAVSLALRKALNPPELAENGETALALATQQAYDVIFLDVQMPGMDGFEVCTRIHDTLLNRTTPVVFVTCHTDFEAQAQSTLSGGNDLIGKPFLTFEITVKALTLALQGRLEGGAPAAGAHKGLNGSRELSPARAESSPAHNPVPELGGGAAKVDLPEPLADDHRQGQPLTVRRGLLMPPPGTGSACVAQRPPATLAAMMPNADGSASSCALSADELARAFLEEWLAAGRKDEDSASRELG